MNLMNENEKKIIVVVIIINCITNLLINCFVSCDEFSKDTAHQKVL